MKTIISWMLPFFLLPLFGAPEPMRVLTDPTTRRPVLYSALPHDSRRVMIPARYQVKPREFRGVWIATYVNLDFPKAGAPAHFQRNYSEMLRKIKAAGFNAVFFQIRPSSDAFYPSELHPFSRFLAGHEGVGYAQFDMLKYMIWEAHRQGLEFHAWLNPYRVAGMTALGKRDYLHTLSPKNFARRNPGAVLCVSTPRGNILLLDPGNPLVRQHLLATVREIVVKYAPDSIHFDDYFYPYDCTGNADLATYRKYNTNPNLSIEDWRRQNVNLMIQQVSHLIRLNNRRQRKNIRFGISPFGIWRNRASSVLGSPTRGNESFSSNYSDSRTWIRNNWIDYIIPQIYWKFSHPKAPYAGLVDWWADIVRGTRVKLYIGHGAHLAFVAEDPLELKNQLLFNSRRPQIAGSAFYSYRRIFEPETLAQRRAVERVIFDCWHGKLPPMPKNRQ